MATWDQLTREQQAVMINAIEEGWLIHVMDEWRARILWAETGSTLTPSDLDDAAKRELIPQFAQVVADLIDRGWIEVGERHDNADLWPLSGSSLRDALHDPASWIMNLDGEHRVIELAATASWKRHVEETA